MKIARKIFNFIDRYQFNELYNKRVNNIPYVVKINSKFVKKDFYQRYHGCVSTQIMTKVLQ